MKEQYIDKCVDFYTSMYIRYTDICEIKTVKAKKLEFLAF